jgi:uncharacterized protein YecE (DUF72 family)
LIRLHGRNHETSIIQGARAASERFNYDYTEEELAEIAARIIKLTKRVDLTHVVLNNNSEDQRQRNARTLTGMIGDNGGIVTRTNVN